MILPLAEVWGKIEYIEYAFSCEIKNRNNGIEPLGVMVGIAVISTWITSLAIYLFQRSKLKREVEERQVYLQNLQENNFDITQDRNALFNQFVIESEVNTNRTVRLIMIIFTIACLPCKLQNNITLEIISLSSLLFQIW